MPQKISPTSPDGAPTVARIVALPAAIPQAAEEAVTPLIVAVAASVPSAAPTAEASVETAVVSVAHLAAKCLTPSVPSAERRLRSRSSPAVRDRFTAVTVSRRTVPAAVVAVAVVMAEAADATAARVATDLFSC